MTVLAGRRESFNAAHQLREPGLPHEQNRRLSGKCANLHGHNYVLEVVVAGQIDPATGHVADLNLLPDVISGQILRDVDHRKPGLPGSVVLDGETRDQRLTIIPFPWNGRPATMEPYRQPIHTTDAVPAAERPAPHPGDLGLAAS
jgi:hypothetical protein